MIDSIIHSGSYYNERCQDFEFNAKEKQRQGDFARGFRVTAALLLRNLGDYCASIQRCT